MKKIIIFCIIFCISFTGCWDYVEISDKAIVAGIAVDYDADLNQLLLTIETAVPKTSKGEMTVESGIISQTGKDFFEALRSLVTKTSKKLLFSHTKVIILSKSMIEKEEILIGVIDFLKRDSKPRDDIWVVLSNESTASEIYYDSKVKLQDITSYHLDDILNNVSSVSKYQPIALWEFVDILSSKGKSLTLPTVELDSSQKSTVPIVFGDAVFNGIKYVGWLNGSESRNLLILLDKLNGGIIVVNPSSMNDTKGSPDKKNVNISLEVLKSSTKITPVFSSDTITMNIEVDLTAIIGEITGEFNYIDKNHMGTLKKICERYITNEISNLLDKLQKDYKTDVIGFGKIVEIENPKLWNNLKSNWNKEFTKINTDVSVNLKIRGSALRSDTIKTER